MIFLLITKFGLNSRSTAMARRSDAGAVSFALSRSASVPPPPNRAPMPMPIRTMRAITPWPISSSRRHRATGRFSSHCMNRFLSGGGGSGRVDDPRSDHPERGHARDEEIVAAARLDELRHAVADEGASIRVGGIGDDHHLALGRLGLLGDVVADHRAGVAADVEVEPILHPLLLDELELAEQARAEGEE